MRSGPRRPYKNFGLFCLFHGSDIGRPYPCLDCGGEGAIAYPKYDDYTIVCPTCEGTGQGTKEACRAAYIDTIEAYRQEKARYERYVYNRRQALKKLTKEEIEALKELGV